VQLNFGYNQEIKVSSGIGRVYTMRYRIRILCGNCCLSLPTVTPLHM
jgi:hypothetical protein